MSEDNVELVRRGYEAFGRGDLETVGKLLRNTEWHEAAGAPQGGVFLGAEAIISGVFGPLMAQVADFKATPKEFLAVGADRVLTVGNYTGNGAGGELDARFAHLWTVSGDEATHFEQFADTALLRQAVGE